MSGYYIWFKVGNDEEFMLPVNPSEVSIQYPANPTNYDVEGIGEIVIPRLPKLATVSFESYFPNTHVGNKMINPDDIHEPEWYVNYFKSLQLSRIPFEITIQRGSDPYYDYQTETAGNVYYDDVVLKAVLLDLVFTDKGGEPGDIYYTLTLSEYRDASPKRLAEIAKQTTKSTKASIQTTDEYTFDFTKDEDEANEQNLEYEEEREIVETPIRDPQYGVLVPGDIVEVTGPVYQQPEFPADAYSYMADKNYASVSRILPVSVDENAYQYHTIYIKCAERNYEGWVDERNCKIIRRAEDRKRTKEQIASEKLWRDLARSDSEKAWYGLVENPNKTKEVKLI